MKPTFFASKESNRNQSSQKLYDDMMAALGKSPLTSEELRAEMGCVKGTTTRFLRMARDAKQVRIARYYRTSGRYQPVYAIGSEPDAPEPEPLSVSSRQMKLMADKPRKDLRNKKIAAKQRKKRLAMYPTIYEDTLAAVTQLSNGCTPQISMIVGMPVVSVYCALREMEHDKKVMRTSKKGAMPIRWAVYAERRASDTGKREEIKITQQNSWSALGL